MTEKLKPCPFCGGEAKLQELKMLDGTIIYYIICRNNSCKVQPMTHEMNTDYEAINAWNNRPENIIMNGELKSCPMCGSNAELIKFASSVYCVLCHNDNCITYERYGYHTKEEAIKAWNSRAYENA